VAAQAGNFHAFAKPYRYAEVTARMTRVLEGRKKRD
jgi:hypothetical protein